MDYTPPRRRPFRHRPRHSLVDNNNNYIPSTESLIASLEGLPPSMATTTVRAYTSTTTTTSTSTSSSRRRNLHASSFDPDCPFSFQPPKKRKIEDYSRPQAGNKLMKLSLAYCDGGTYEGERYRVGNMLADDDSVYCTERYSCNIVLQHETEQPFTLEYLEIKAPPHGFTSPVSEGVIAVTNEDFNPVVKKIASYGRMVPLKKSSKRRSEEEYDSVELAYVNLRNRYTGREELDEEEEADDYADGERLTEFDMARYRAEEEEEDKDEEEEEGEGGDELEAEEEGVNVGDSDGEEVLEDTAIDGESDGDDETVTPATTTGSIPWPPAGSRRLIGAADPEDDNDDESGNQHDCPYEIAGAEEEEEVEEDGEPTDGESSDYELRRWLLRNNTEERRRRRRRREEEAAAEVGFTESDGASRGEAYMRFQLRDNKAFIVFNPPRYCKYAVLKLWGSKIDNVDIQSILGYGFYGKRVFPAIEMR
ncbi:hypothetical protein EYR41_000277 [Orbilia oligospora]|uniref:Uncharacterized protein n=1 Tax=Orbilia oligospora TaxID=2813651 RepID=A0A7C8TWZ9_ORBOL|nr:hypothetical protein TWF751_001404 [Orbilia oligospora]KAF3293723.1 hypothetical protein TWF132_004316 [Orbilia oligospora]TGJ73163.1 hypothetical protein EYR41_000277 [Orbilia oligospora]